MTKEFLPEAYEEMMENGKEKLDVYYVFNDEYSEAAILYENRQPWEMSERVKKMKKEDMQEIFNKYLSALDVKADFERQSVEFWAD